MLSCAAVCRPAAVAAAALRALRAPRPLRPCRAVSTAASASPVAAAPGRAPSASAMAPVDPGHTLASLPKTWRFTQSLPPDPQFPSPAASHRAPRTKLGPRLVRGALFTWVRPEQQTDPELLAVSPAALRDLGIKPSEAATDAFRQTVAGNVLWGWDETTRTSEKDDVEGAEPPPSADSGDASTAGYPWAQCYGGYQFGQWAGQLGDGRAISLFEVPVTYAGAGAGAFPCGRPRPRSYEVQLKGAGMTPYSRFADGRAVLRSSIREFVVSEALNALGIPSTRALSLTLLPNVLVHRERLEPAAIVARFAESWLRLGTFDLLRTRGDRPLTRELADYVAETVYGGWHTLPGRLADSKLAADDQSVARLLRPPRGIPRDAVEGSRSSGSDDGGDGNEAEDSESGTAENRYARLYREIVRRNARTVAHWQVYGFMNGVLNTDNTSVLGLSLDFGPFAFLDNFDPSYTPNHDDHHLRYSYRNQPSIIWWNLVRFGEALGELLAAGARVDDQAFVDEGIIGLAKVDVLAAGGSAADVEIDMPTTPKDNTSGSSNNTSSSPPIPPRVERAAGELASHAEDIIMRVGEEYKNLFIAEYKRLFMARLGLPPPSHADLAAAADMDPLITGLLDVMEHIELDFNMFFRRLSAVRLADIATDDGRRATAEKFFYREGVTAAVGEEAGRRQVAEWLAEWRERVISSSSGDGNADDGDDVRIRAMKAVNPNFVPRGWVLDEVIRRVEHDGDRDVLRRITHMALHPFADAWSGHDFDGQPYEGDALEEVRWTQDVPEKQRAMQCSCSS